MANVHTLISQNVRGLGYGVKRVAFFSTVKAHKPAVVCLQETHLHANFESVLQRSQYSCIIANIYVPTPFSLDSLKCLAQFIASYSNIPIWVLGDFNWAGKQMDTFSCRYSGSP